MKLTNEEWYKLYVKGFNREEKLFIEIGGNTYEVQYYTNNTYWTKSANLGFSLFRSNCSFDVKFFISKKFKKENDKYTCKTEISDNYFLTYKQRNESSITNNEGVINRGGYIINSRMEDIEFELDKDFEPISHLIPNSSEEVFKFAKKAVKAIYNAIMEESK